MLQQYFQQGMGTHTLRRYGLNFQSIGLIGSNLSELEEPFSEEEVHRVIMSMPSEKASARTVSQACSTSSAEQ